MPEIRAHTYIDAGEARAGTPWSERCWSAFLGNTVSLRDTVTGREWLVRPSDEIALNVEGRRLSLMDFQGGNWSEECNPHGATLVCQFTSETVSLRVRCTAMHDCPGLLREMTIMNRTRHPLAIAGPVLDHFALALPPKRKELFRRASKTVVTAGDDEGMLLIGHDTGVAVELSLEMTPEITLRCQGDFVLAPGQTRHLPDTHVLPFRGSFEQLSGHGYATFLRAVRNLRDWQRDGDVIP